MEKSLLKYLAIPALLTLTCNVVTGIVPTPTPKITPTPEILRFENNFVSFDYPAGLLVFNSDDPAFITYPISNHLEGRLVAGLADPQEMNEYGNHYRVVGIFRHVIPYGETLAKVREDAYLSVNRYDGWVKTSGPVTLAGLPAYQETYGVHGGEASYEMRDIWAEKDTLVIRVSIWTPFHNPENFAAFQSLTTQILNSLVIKDDAPPLVETATPEPTPLPTPIPAAMLLHFENNIVAFDYLKGMTLYSNNTPAFICYPAIDFGGETVVGLGDSRFFDFGTYSRSIRITRLVIPSGSNLEVIFSETYRKAEKKFPTEEGILATNRLVDVNGWTGLQKTYRVYSGEPAYELRDIWLQKGNEIFILSIWTVYTNADDFAAFQASAEVLLKSLQIK